MMARLRHVDGSMRHKILESSHDDLLKMLNAPDEDNGYTKLVIKTEISHRRNETIELFKKVKY